MREAVGAPPEIVFKRGARGLAARLTKLNGAVAATSTTTPRSAPIAWKGAGGLELEGLVLLPRDREPGPLPTIVDIHGGPSWAAKYAFNPGYALPFAAAGYAVFLPNYRGNVGWGQEFARLNIGDPGGAEFQDILAGIDRCVAAGHRRRRPPRRHRRQLWRLPDRLGGRDDQPLQGRGDGLRHRQPMSCHYSCNHDFQRLHQRRPADRGALPRCRPRPLAALRLDKPTTPTLIIHGSEDRCTPLGQAQEFYAALLERGVDGELVVYPREGHGLRERGHRLDAWRRAVAWFDRYLRPDRAVDTAG